MRNIDADAPRHFNAVQAFVVADFDLLSVNDDNCHVSYICKPHRRIDRMKPPRYTTTAKWTSPIHRRCGVQMDEWRFSRDQDHRIAA